MSLVLLQCLLLALYLQKVELSGRMCYLPDLVVCLIANPVGKWSVLLDLFGHSYFLPKALDRTLNDITQKPNLPFLDL